MPFYIRKSISAGPFRFNLSKSGLGLSVGVRGFRVGTGPRGHYVHAGRGGIYYRSSLGGAGERRQREGKPQSYPTAPQPPSDDLYHPTVQMVEVESGDVMEMADSRFQSILDDLNGKADQARMSVVLGGIAAGVWLLSGLLINFTAAIILLPVIAIAVAVGAYMDGYKRAAVVFYDLSGEPHDAYVGVVEAFEKLAACAGKWHVKAGGAVRDFETWKRNAGAAHLVSKSPTLVGFATPPVLKCNVTPPALAVGKQTLYLLPDMVLVVHDGRFGAVPYDALQVARQPSRFIEEGALPGDATIVGQTWRFVNKDGGPDRRFNDNRQLPICLYEAMHFSSSSGLNELLEFSKADAGAPFVSAIRTLATVLSRAPKQAPAALPAT